MTRQTVSFSDVLTFTRASVGWYWDANGVLQSAAIDTPRFNHKYNGSSWVDKGIFIEKASTNIFLNSDAPATQTITVVSGDVYTISCYGSGDITLSDAGTGVVTEGSPVTITASTASLTCTVGGTLDYAQVESGDKATSIIITATAAVTREPDNIQTKVVV